MNKHFRIEFDSGNVFSGFSPKMTSSFCVAIILHGSSEFVMDFYAILAKENKLTAWPMVNTQTKFD